jgi:hypothetical protein
VANRPRCARLFALPVGIARSIVSGTAWESTRCSGWRGSPRGELVTIAGALGMLRLEAQAEGDTEVRPFVREAGIDAKHRITLEGHTKADPVGCVYSCPGQRVE